MCAKVGVILNGTRFEHCKAGTTSVLAYLRSEAYMY